MAGTVPLSLTQQLDEFGEPLAGGKLYLIQAGTTSTPQNGFQDSALTLPWPNPIVLDAAGRLPQFFLADGSIKVRLTDVNGVEKLVADGIIVTGASSGGGGGSPVDPTTVFTTGDLKATYGTGVVAGFVRCNARTIGSAGSPATERANADTQPLFVFLYGQDPNLVVSGGRTGNAAADYAANKTITLPDWRGRVLGFLDDMGNTAAGRLTTSFFGATATVLGAIGGSESHTLTLGEIPTGITSGVSIPGLSVPGLSVPGLSVPGLSVPGLSVPALSVPSLSVAGLSIPSLSVAGLSVPGLSVAGLSVPGLSVPSLSVPSLSVSGSAAPASGFIPISSLTISSLQTSGSATANITPANNNGSWSASTSFTVTGNTGTGTTGTGTTGTGTTGTGTTGTGTTGAGATATGTTGTGATGAGTTGTGTTGTGTTGGGITGAGTTGTGTTGTATVTATSNSTGGNPHAIVPPTMLATIYIKL